MMKRKNQFGNWNKYAHCAAVLFILSCAVQNKFHDEIVEDCFSYKKMFFLEHFENDTVKIIVNGGKILDTVISSKLIGVAFVYKLKGRLIEVQVNKDTLFRFDGCDERYNDIIFTKEDSKFESIKAKDTVIVIM